MAYDGIVKGLLPTAILMRAALLVVSVTSGAVAQFVDTVIRLPCPEEVPSGRTPIALNLTDRLLYVGDEESELLLAVDECRGAVVYQVELDGCVTALCYNPVGNRLYCATDGDEGMLVLDGSTGVTTNTVEIPDEPLALVMDSAQNRLYAVCLGGTIAVVDCNTDRLIRMVEVADWFESPVTSYVQATGRFFCSSEEMDTVYCYDCRTDSVVGRIPVGTEPLSLCFNPVNGLLYCSCRQDTLLKVIDPVSCSIVCTIAGRGGWGKLCCNDRNNKIYGGQGAGLNIVDANTNRLTTNLWPSSEYTVLAYSSRQNAVYAIADGG